MNKLVTNSSISALTKKNQSLEWEHLLFEFFEDYSSEHTKKNYSRDLKQFVHFMKEFFPLVHDWSNMERLHAVAYKKWLTEMDSTSKTINRKLSSLSSFCKFLMEKNKMDQNPFNAIRRPKQVVTTPTEDLNDEEVAKLLTTADEDKGPSAPLHRAVIYLLFSTGLRKAEVINAKRKDLKSQDGLITLTVKVKGGKLLEKVLHPRCFEVINEYLYWMKLHGREIHQEDWIFQPNRNPLDGNLIKPLNPKSIDYILKQIARRAGIFKRISPHSARATYIGSAIEQGVDLYRIAQDVGHNSVKTTEEYNKRKIKLKESPALKLPYLKKSA